MLDHLCANSEEHVSDILLPLSHHGRHRNVFAHHFLCHLFNLFETIKLAFVAVVDKVDLFLVDQALDALVNPLLS